MARRFGDAGGAQCWAGEGKEEQQRVSSKLHADLAQGLARACSLGKGQQRAAKGSKGQRAVLAGWHRWGQALDLLLRLGRSRPPRRHPAGCSLLASHLPAL